MKQTWNFIKQLVSAWSEDRVSSLSAALAYYTLFSLTPILLICVALAGLLFGPEAAQGRILDQISGLVGREAGEQIQLMLENANKPVTAVIAQIVGVIVLIFGASGVFSEIQSGLNTIWEVKSDPNRTWFNVIKQRFLSFTMVLGFAFLLLVSLILGIFITNVSTYIANHLGINASEVIFTLMFSFGINVILFAMMFKILPDAEIHWREVWLGAIVTTLFFDLGKYLLGIYLNQVNVISSFGAAGSLVILLIWVYYTAQIFFIGAEITKIFSKRRRKIVPTRNSIRKHEKPG